MTKINYKHKIDKYSPVRLLDQVHFKLGVRSLKEKMNFSLLVGGLLEIKGGEEIMEKIRDRLKAERLKAKEERDKLKAKKLKAKKLLKLN